MVLDFRAVRELRSTFLQRRQGIPIIALLERDPAQRIGYIRVARRGVSRSLRQVIGLVDLSKLIGIQHGEIVECQRGIWRRVEHLFVNVARLGKMLQTFLEYSELYQSRDTGVVLGVLLKLVDCLLLA